jgi:hypothetical protein
MKMIDMTLKTLKDIECDESGKGDFVCESRPLRKEASKWIKNLQYKNTKYPIILEQFPDNMKGSIAKDNWNNTMFRYGCEYGMLSYIIYFFNITEDDLK